MQKIGFYIIYTPVWLISKLPFPLLYLISDFIYFFVFYVVGYRKKLVFNNLRLVFPSKSESEIKQIRRKFYHHFVDIFMEMVKTFTISPEELEKHFKISNLELINKLGAENKSVMVVGSHFANWEWAIRMGVGIPHMGFIVFTKIQNPFWNKKVKESREQFGLKLIDRTETIPKIEKNFSENLLSLYGFLSDQSPQLGRAYYWTQFLGQRVPVLTGAEMLAKKHNMAFVFLRINKIKRGYYETTYDLITDNSTEFKDFELTEKYLRLCEQQIYKQPEYYFWTHNRFKLMGKEHLSPANRN
jgi:KDO2-lipid IV(A) lauroyltransferase